jgi:hypothetical protein
MDDCARWLESMGPMSDALGLLPGLGPGDDDDDDEDGAGGGNGGNIDPDDDEGYEDEDDDGDEDEDEEPLRCVARAAGSGASLRRSNPWYDARVRRSARF